MIPQTIPPAEDTDAVCQLAERWLISGELSRRLAHMAGLFGLPVTIISGHRTREQQEALRKQGRPTADPDKSTHLSCPATGADVMPAVAVTNNVRALLGAAGTSAGLRWGGGSPVDPETGIPSDWNHFDLGPRGG